MHQKYYIEKILAKFAKDLKPIQSIPIPTGIKIEPSQETATKEAISLYQQKIGSLIYLGDKTRVDLAYYINLLARFMSNPGPLHEKLLTKLLSYLKGVPDLGLLYHSKPTLVGYADADWGGDISTRRSTTGYLFLFMNSPISWNSRLQRTVALSSCEAEYMALKEAIKEQAYIKAILREIGLFKDLNTDTIYTNSNSAIELAKNPVYHSRTKHVDIQYHYVRENVVNGNTKLTFIPTKGQLADGLTKPLNIEKYKAFTYNIGLRPISHYRDLYEKEKAETNLSSLGKPSTRMVR